MNRLSTVRIFSTIINKKSGFSPSRAVGVETLTTLDMSREYVQHRERRLKLRGHALLPEYEVQQYCMKEASTLPDAFLRFCWSTFPFNSVGLVLIIFCLFCAPKPIKQGLTAFLPGLAFR